MDCDDRLELFRPDNPDPDLPGSEGLGRSLERRPDLRRRHEEILESDEAIRLALDAEPIPESLRARVVAAAAARRAELAAGARRRLRRRMLAALTLTTAAALVLFVWQPFAARELSATGARDGAISLFDRWDDLDIQPREWHDDASWPAGFQTRYYRGSALVKVAGVECLALRFASDARRALVLMIPKSAFPTGAEWVDYDQPAPGGRTVVVLDSGAYYCVAVVQGAMEDLEDFRRHKSLT